MPINKAIPTTLHNQSRAYVVVPSDQLARIGNSDAVAIWSYLLDKPQNWIPRRSDIMDRFGLGRHRYDKAIAELKQLGLVWIEETRNDQGQIVTRALCVSSDPRSENEQLGGDHPRSENPQVGKSDHLNRTDYLNMKELLQEPPANTRRKLQPDWLPSQELVERCINLGLTIEDPDFAVREFVDYWTNKTTARTNRGWDTTWINYVKMVNKKGMKHEKRTSTDLIAQDFERAFSGG